MKQTGGMEQKKGQKLKNQTRNRGKKPKKREKKKKGQKWGRALDRAKRLTTKKSSGDCCSKRVGRGGTGGGSVGGKKPGAAKNASNARERKNWGNRGLVSEHWGEKKGSGEGGGGGSELLGLLSCPK